MVGVETVANWYGLNLPVDGVTDATLYMNIFGEINKRAKENDMSEKFKIGDIVSPNVDYYWAKDWMESEIIGRGGAGWEIKNKAGNVGNIVTESMWAVVEQKPKIEWSELLRPALEIGNKYVIANPEDTVLDGVDACQIIGIYDGHYIIEFNDGEINKSWKVGQEKVFFECWKPYKEPETITGWTFVYRDNGIWMDSEVYDTEDGAKSYCEMMYGADSLIKTIKIEYTPD